MKQFPRLRSRLEAIGLTKLELVARGINPRNVDERLEFAETHTVKQLAGHFASSTPVQNSRCVMLYFSADEYDRLAKALIPHGAEQKDGQLIGQEQALLSLIQAVD